jgi:flagellar motor protein MotB
MIVEAAFLAWLWPSLPKLPKPPAVETEVIGHPAERHMPDGEPLQEWALDPALLSEQRGDRLEIEQVEGEEVETVKLRDVIPAIRFASGVAQIPPDYVERLARVLEDLRDRQNVRLYFSGHADSQPLSDALARVFGDNTGLSRERAGEVAEYFKNALGLPPEAIVYEWAGDTRPVATNATDEGRSLNRRVEVEVWYDEPRSVLREREVVVTDDIRRVKVCRMETLCKLRYQEGHAKRARLRNVVSPLAYVDEQTAPTAEFIQQVQWAIQNVGSRQNVVVRFIGHTDDVPLAGRDERIYGDHLALSKARARRCRSRSASRRPWSRAMARAAACPWPPTPRQTDARPTVAWRWRSGTTIPCSSCRTSPSCARAMAIPRWSPGSTTRPGDRSPT